METQSQSLYLDVYEKILTAIKNGEYSGNKPFLTEKDLCEKYHVSRTTIRQALQCLKDTGAIYAVSGSGTYIRPQVFTQPLTKFYSFTDTLKSSNILIHNDIISYDVIAADASLAAQTKYPEGTLFHKLVRLRSAQDYPLMLERTYLPKGRFATLDLDVLSKGSLYEFLRTKYGFRVTSAEENFRPIMPRVDEKQFLKIPITTPCVLLERLSYEDDMTIEYTKSIVRGDKYIFHVDMLPPEHDV